MIDYPAHSLASLLQLFCGYITDKQHQMADWRIRPLPEPLSVYARSDTHFLLSIYDQLRNALLETSKDEANPQRAMREVLDLSAQTALKYYEREGYDEVTGKGRMGWSGTARKYLSKSSMELKPGLVFRRLHAWRDRVAREEDENPQYVVIVNERYQSSLRQDRYILPADIVKNLSMRLPTGLQAVRNMIGSRAPIAFSKVDQILKVVNAARSEWRREGRASSPPSDVVEAMYSKTKQTTEPATESNTDVWDAVQSSAPSMTGTSSLFGHTLKPAKAISAPAKKQISSLFGNIVSKRESEAAWASFATVQREVHTELEPALIIPLNSSDPAGTTSVQQESAFEPETVPFILPGSRTTLPPILHEPVLSIEDDGVVPVKRKQAKKRKEVVTHEIADLTTSVIPPAFNTEEVTASGSIDDLPPMPDEGPPISGKSKKQSRPAPDQNTKRETVVTTDFASLVTNPLEPAANSKASTSTDVVPEVVESLVPLADQAPPTRNLAIKVLRKMQSRMLEVQASPNMPAEPVVRENKKRKAKVTPQISSLISSAGPSSLPGDETDDADDSHEGVPTAPATEQVGDDLPAVQDASPPSLPKVRRKRKEKINTEDIPEFDYADEPNLLDHPGKFQKQGKGQGREKKKAKAKPGQLRLLHLEWAQNADRQFIRWAGWWIGESACRPKSAEGRQ